MLRILLLAALTAAATPATATLTYQQCSQELSDLKSIDQSFTRFLNGQRLGLVVSDAPQGIVDTNTMTRSSVEVVLGNYVEEFAGWCELLRRRESS